MLLQAGDAQEKLQDVEEQVKWPNSFFADADVC